MQIDLDALERDCKTWESNIGSPPFLSASIGLALIAKVRELEQENALLREVVAEYNDCIRYMDAGGDFHEFQRITIDAARGGKEHG
ncbi:hypothetical protein K7G19_21105 [Cupriavidus sp. DB3]|uniref:hypothetical protein n=1 Tax=Cupriavidus sp. DB3 TaxID=2873259 RepID=UPI001CF1BECB|nr:hypothetical protein [Cupriavidus sp. DB3]MCA7086093.1 hypothetical protein [Cupriavidus sp. DB3]